MASSSSLRVSTSPDELKKKKTPPVLPTAVADNGLEEESEGEEEEESEEEEEEEEEATNSNDSIMATPENALYFPCPSPISSRAPPIPVFTPPPPPPPPSASSHGRRFLSEIRTGTDGNPGGASAAIAEDERKSREKEHKRRSKNWTRTETLKLIGLRVELAPRFAKFGRKSGLWDEITEVLREQSFFRDGQQCRDKWDKLMAGYKEVRDGLKDKEDNPYFDQLHSFLTGDGQPAEICNDGLSQKAEQKKRLDSKPSQKRRRKSLSEEEEEDKEEELGNAADLPRTENNSSHSHIGEQKKKADSKNSKKAEENMATTATAMAMATATVAEEKQRKRKKSFHKEEVDGREGLLRTENGGQSHAPATEKMAAIAKTSKSSQKRGESTAMAVEENERQSGRETERKSKKKKSFSKKEEVEEEDLPRTVNGGHSQGREKTAAITNSKSSKKGERGNTAMATEEKESRGRRATEKKKSFSKEEEEEEEEEKEEEEEEERDEEEEDDKDEEEEEEEEEEDLMGVKVLLEKVLEEQQRLFKGFLRAMEEKELNRERLRLETEEKWRAEERAERCIFHNTMILLMQKLSGDNPFETSNPPSNTSKPPLSTSNHPLTPSNPPLNTSNTSLNTLKTPPKTPSNTPSNDLGQGLGKKRSKNWKRTEVLHLIRRRGEMESRFAKSTRRAALWEELASSLASLGVHRDSKQCREKWEKLTAEYKDVSEGRRSKSDSPYFNELSSIIGGRHGEAG